MSKNRKLLDDAAYYCLNGATVTQIIGNGKGAVFVMDIPDDVWHTIKQKPLVNYKEYLKKRSKLKSKQSKAFGITPTRDQMKRQKL